MIQVKGDAQRRLEARADRLGKAIRQATAQSGAHVLAETRRASVVVTGTTRRGYQQQVVTYGNVTTTRVASNQASAAVAERGRRRGAKMPPVRALIPWVKKRWGLEGKEARRAAYVLARKIAREGIPARPVLKPALRNSRPAIRRIFVARIREALRD